MKDGNLIRRMQANLLASNHIAFVLCPVFPCRAFVSAAGIHSVYESAFHGLPLVALPFTKEQLGNAQVAAWRGFAHISPQALVYMKKTVRRCNTLSQAAAAGDQGDSKAAQSSQAADLTGSAPSDRSGDIGAPGSEESKRRCASGLQGDIDPSQASHADEERTIVEDNTPKGEGCICFNSTKLVEDVLKVRQQQPSTPENTVFFGK
jgi:hypothetical protein